VTTTDAVNTEARHHTALVLMKSPEADATIDALSADAGVHVHDLGSYWKLTSAGDIRVEMPAVADELGEPITLSKWLVVMSSYVGRISTGDDWFTVTSGMGDLDTP
jgi:hypothetical protein